MISDVVLVALISSASSFVGAFFGLKVKLHYIERDIVRHNNRLNNHSQRIRALEIGD